MRTFAGVLLLAGLVGCDFVFTLQEPEGTVDAQPDIDAIDAPPPRCANGNDATRQVLQAVADTMISSAVPAQNYNGLGVATISTDIGPMGSRGLFRFQIGAIDPATVLELQLIVPSALASGDCGPSCGSCAGIEKVGEMRAFPVNGAWIENEATWARASSALAWETPGASGVVDRGPELGPAQHAISMDTAFVAEPTRHAEILAWSLAGNLSFVVETTGAKQVVRTRENTCDGGAPGAQLEVLGC